MAAPGQAVHAGSFGKAIFDSLLVVELLNGFRFKSMSDISSAFMVAFEHSGINNLTYKSQPWVFMPSLTPQLAVEQESATNIQIESIAKFPALHNAGEQFCTDDSHLP